MCAQQSHLLNPQLPEHGRKCCLTDHTSRPLSSQPPTRAGPGLSATSRAWWDWRGHTGAISLASQDQAHTAHAQPGEQDPLPHRFYEKLGHAVWTRYHNSGPRNPRSCAGAWCAMHPEMTSTSEPYQLSPMPQEEAAAQFPGKSQATHTLRGQCWEPGGQPGHPSLGLVEQPRAAAC